MPVIVHPSSRTIPVDIVSRWRNVPAAVVADVSKSEALLDPRIRPLLPPGLQPRLFGFAVTARCTPPDFGAVLYALDQVGPGDVLVIATDQTVSHAMIGGILGGHLHRKAAAGIICDGAVRDVAELARVPGFSVYARAITPLGPTGLVEGTVNGDVQIGGLAVRAGDLIIGDDDGLVCLSPDRAIHLIDAAEAKLALEDNWIASLKGGATVAQTFKLPSAD